MTEARQKPGLHKEEHQNRRKRSAGYEVEQQQGDKKLAHFYNGKCLALFLLLAVWQPRTQVYFTESDVI